MLLAQSLSLSLVGSLRVAVDGICSRDSSLADQIRRAASSIVLNTAEGAYSRKGNSLVRYHSALGSANEVRVGLQLALAWGYVRDDQIGEPLKMLDRLIGLLWGLTHRTKR